MEVYMPLVAVLVGALIPVVVGLSIARREREEQELQLVPLEQRADRIPTHERRPT